VTASEPSTATPALGVLRVSRRRLTDWAGHASYPVFIIGETAKRYEITPMGTESIPLGGKLGSLNPGQGAFVPKGAVTLNATEEDPRE
jgi:hypothetical protein